MSAIRDFLIIDISANPLTYPRDDDILKEPPRLASSPLKKNQSNDRPTYSDELTVTFSKNSVSVLDNDLLGVISLNHRRSPVFSVCLYIVTFQRLFNWTENCN